MSAGYTSGKESHERMEWKKLNRAITAVKICLNGPVNPMVTKGYNAFIIKKFN